MPLYARLEPLKLYALRQNSLIDCELAAYEAAFSILDEALREILAQAFVQTATGEGLKLHEKLVGLQDRPSLDLDSRRTLVIYRRSIAPFDFNLTGMVNSILGMGMEAEIIEDYEGESLQIVSKALIDMFFDLDSVKQSVSLMLPAHLESEFDMGHTSWEAFEAYDITWDDWDSIDFTWDEFDIDTGNLFNGVG